MQEHYADKRYAEGISSYLEKLVVADMKFLQEPNSTDYEQYLFTTVNMASGIIHDDTMAHQMDAVLVHAYDTAVLVKKHDVCAGSDNYGSAVGCCDADLSCAICEDTGLVVVTLLAHEIDHC
jgi:hypothetical protein